KVDDQAQQLYTGAPVQLTDGTHIVEYWSEAAGYDSEVHQTIKNIKVDTVRPTLTVTKPKEGDVVPEAIIEIQGTYVEDNILQVTCAVGIGANPVTLVIDKVAKTFSGKVMLTKGQNILDIKAIDEAGNTSLSPAVNVTYDPDRTCTLQLIILNPKDNSQPTYGVQLVNESQIDYHHIELKTNIQGTSSCDLSKVEVSSEGDATKWVQVPYDPIKKNFNGDVSLKAKAGNCKITIKVTDKNGKTETIVRTLVCQVKIEFIGIKSYHTINDAKKPIPSPTKSLHNGSAITNLSSYPFISQAGRTLAPFRFVGNAFGATVDYDPIRKAATYKFEGKTVELMLGSNTATIIEGGQRRTVPLDPQNASVRAEVVGDRTYVPIRFFESIFGWKPVYTAATRTVTITFP
ncbi:MAG TPA: stalk domain-containing protein, partial [Caldisericia bacterium]|nr:stalk domain-containing protein [Caldisericia bacterium]